jgi:SET domain-containing protein
MTTAASWLSPKASKGEPSAIQGRGLFAIEPIGAGEVVAVKGGHIVDTATLRTLPPHLQETDIQIAENLHLAALTDDEFESVMLFVNHSCDANVGIAGNIVLMAMRDVAPGDELTLDYCLFDGSPTTPMECRCGSAACRKVITGEDWRRPELQARYAGWFSRYLADRQAAIGAGSPGA